MEGAGMAFCENFYQSVPVNGPANSDYTGESFYCYTFTHPPVLPQHVACWAFTLVRTHYINTAEGTQQRILGALVDVWIGNRKTTSYTRRHP